MHDQLFEDWLRTHVCCDRGFIFFECVFVGYHPDCIARFSCFELHIGYGDCVCLFKSILLVVYDYNRVCGDIITHGYPDVYTHGLPMTDLVVKRAIKKYVGKRLTWLVCFFVLKEKIRG